MASGNPSSVILVIIDRFLVPGTCVIFPFAFLSAGASAIFEQKVALMSINLMETQAVVFGSVLCAAALVLEIIFLNQLNKAIIDYYNEVK